MLRNDIYKNIYYIESQKTLNTSGVHVSELQTEPI